MIRARPSAELLMLLHELSAIAGLPGPDEKPPGCDWKAWVDGKEVPLVRCDYLFQGVYVEPGLHEVELRYRPPGGVLWSQALSALIVVGAAMGLFIVSGKRNRAS